MSRGWLSRQTIAIGGAFLVSAALIWVTARSRCRSVDAGFWFEEVRYDSGRLDGPLTREETDAIASVARAEIARAFTGLNITFADRRDAAYRVRVVQEVRDLRVRWHASLPAESRAVPGLGGQGAVSFFWLASAAVSYAPEDASRSALLEAVGRGIGRAAVHEFAHILLPHATIDDSGDIRSYEYGSAARREQYFGEMHWGPAWPLLQARLKPCEKGS